MADKKISELVSLDGKDVAATDFFPVVDVSVAETKSLTRDELRNAVNAIQFTATKALATTAAASLPDDTIIEVAADESLAGARTRYKVAAGALVFDYGVVTQAELDASNAKLAVFASYEDGIVSSRPCYAAISVNPTRTTIDRHAFEDWSQLDTTDTNLGYASFDAKATMNNSLQQNHFVGYQSRNIYTGAGNLTTYFNGYDTAMVHNGAGTIANAAGIHVRDITGTGTITFHAAVWIDTIAKGSTKWGIYSDAGNKHMLGGPTGEIQTGVAKVAAVTYASDVADKSIAYGYGTAGVANFGVHDFYNGKTGLVAKVSSVGLNVYGVTDSSGAIVPGRYFKNDIPATAIGSIVYCKDGRKVGEGAGAGTGVPVYYSSGAWRVFSTDAAVTV